MQLSNYQYDLALKLFHRHRCQHCGEIRVLIYNNHRQRRGRGRAGEGMMTNIIFSTCYKCDGVNKHRIRTPILLDRIIR